MNKKFMSEKTNPLNKQDHPHQEGTQNNTPPRSRPQPGKEQQPVGSRKASTREQKNTSDEKEGGSQENPAGQR
jgi:hypothetical protein